METTDRAMQVTRPGALELVEPKTPAPGTGQVLIEVLACGMVIPPLHGGSRFAKLKRPGIGLTSESHALPAYDWTDQR